MGEREQFINHAELLANAKFCEDDVSDIEWAKYLACAGVDLTAAEAKKAARMGNFSIEDLDPKATEFFVTEKDAKGTHLVLKKGKL